MSASTSTFVSISKTHRFSVRRLLCALALVAFVCGLLTIPTPANGALIISFNVTGTTNNNNWEGKFYFSESFDAETSAISHIASISKITATNGLEAIEFKPDSTEPQHGSGNLEGIDWYSSVPGGGIVFFRFAASAEPITLLTPWQDVAGKSYDLDSSSSGFEKASTTHDSTGGSLEFGQVVPEPSSMTLAALILGATAVFARRRVKRHAASDVAP